MGSSTGKSGSDSKTRNQLKNSVDWGQITSPGQGQTRTNAVVQTVAERQVERIVRLKSMEKQL